MKTLVVLTFMTFAMVGNSQQIDTIYTQLATVTDKKVNMTINQVSGDQITQIKESINFDKAVKKIEALQHDSTKFIQYLQQLNQTENQIKVERKRIRLMQKDAADLLARLRSLLPSLQ